MHARDWGKGSGAVLRVAATLAIAAAALPASASARNLYVTHEGYPQYKEGGILAMSIGADGKLTKGPAITAVGGAGYQGIAIPPSGRHIFPAAWGAAVLTGMTVNPDGSLTGDGNSSLNSVFTPWGVSAAPNGRFVFVSNGEPANVSAFDVSSGIPSLINLYPAGSEPRGVATTPDGGHVYVANKKSNNVSAYSVGATGALTHIADIPLPAGPPSAQGPNGVVISPDGRHLFTANSVSGNLTSFSIEPSGLLVPIGTFPSTDGGLSNLALSPDGRHLFASQELGALVVAFNVGADGSLAQVGAGLPTGGEASTNTGIGVTPDGRYLFVTTVGTLLAGKVAAFAIQPSGALVGVIGSPFPTGLMRPDNQSLAIVPDQSPVASFTTSTSRKGLKASFDGSASSDSDGSVARYDWDFGDGKALADGGPKPSHAYAQPGVYTVALTVTDNEGCSSPLVYTGQTASCSGAPAATESIKVGKLRIALIGAKKQALSKQGIVLRVKCNVAPCKVKASAVVKGLKLKTRKASARVAKVGRKARLKLAFAGGAFARLKQALVGRATLTAKVSASAEAGGLTAKAKRKVVLTG